MLRALFGSPKAVGKVTDAAIKGLDALVLTKEEKLVFNAELREWYLKYLAATEPQNVARRLIALMVTALWLALIAAGVIVWPLSAEFSAYVFRAVGESVNVPFSIIIGFYFATHAIRAAK